MSNVIMKNVNITPLRGQKVYEINPALIGPTTDVDLNTMIIRRIIKAGHKVEENLPNGKTVILNLENFDSDNTIEKKITASFLKGSADYDEMKKSYDELKDKYDELEATHNKSIEDNQKVLDEKEEKIKELTEANGKMSEEIKMYEEEINNSSNTTSNAPTEEKK